MPEPLTQMTSQTDTITTPCTAHQDELNACGVQNKAVKLTSSAWETQGHMSLTLQPYSNIVSHAR